MRQFFGIFAIIFSSLMMPIESSFATHKHHLGAKQQVIAVFPKHFPPQYQMTPEGEPSGFAIEVMKEIERRADLEVKYQPLDKWPQALELIKKNKAHIIPNQGITPERAKHVFYTRPYESFSIVIFVHHNETNINGLKDLAGKRIATTETNVANKVAKRNNLPVIHFENTSLTMQALANKEVDAVILPDIVGYKAASHLSVAEKIREVGEPLMVIERAMAVNKDYPELFEKINHAMNEYLLSQEFADTQESWDRVPKQEISLDQLLKLNSLLLTIIFITGIFLYRKRLQKLKKTSLEARLMMRMLSLLCVLSVAIVLTSMVSIALLYNAAFEEQKSRLINLAQSKARFIESVARFDIKHSKQLGLSELESHLATISQVRDSHKNLRGFGETGEFTFAQRKQDKISMLLRQRHLVTVKPQNIPWDAAEAEPMRRALSGRAGTLVGLDYRGVLVLAAHEPVSVLDAGIVAKIDLKEVREPYIRAALMAFSVTLCILAIGLVAFVSLTGPIVRTLSHAHARLKALVNLSPNLIVISNNKGQPILFSKELEKLNGKFPTSGESTITHNDGSKQTYVTTTFPLTINDESLGNCQISTNITYRAEAEKQLKQLAMAFEHAGEGMVITDDHGTIIKVNHMFETITGYSSNELVGKNPKLLKSGHHDKKFYQKMWHEIQHNGSWRGEILNRRKGGDTYLELLNIKGIYDKGSFPSYYVGVFSDISSIKRAQNELQHLAYHDPLTKLPNRLLFRDRLENSIRQAHRENKMIALFSIDLDRFKLINDSLGHQMGDQMLKQLSTQLQSLIRDSDTVARMGGDEFTIICYGFEEQSDIAVLAQKIVRGIQKGLKVEGRQLKSSISLGIAIYPYDGLSYEELLKNSDAALYKAKEYGRNNFQFYTEELGQNAKDKFSLENKLLQAMENEEFTVHYQAQFDMNNKKLVSAEALVRWQHPELGLVAPSQFIPLMEENGMIVQLGQWVLRAACKQMKQWLDKGYDLECISVNLSGAQLGRAGLFDIVQKALEEVNLPPEKLELEITESFIMQNVQESIHLLNSFSELGISIAIDDFGTGYSSLAYLKKLPVHTLKIDRAFVKDLPKEEDSAISKAVIALGHSLGMRIIAEGVEEEAHWQFLKAEGCDIAQGYLVGKPVSANKFAQDYFLK